MIRAGSIDKGTCLLLKGDPYLVAEREFVNPGKGSAFVRLKLKNLKTGQVLRQVMKTQDNVEEIAVEEKECQFLYADADGYHFMNTETYDQFQVPKDGFEEQGLFMKEGDSYKVVLWEGDPIDVKLPFKMVFTVTKAEDAIRGDTVTGATKVVTLETGLEVRVPIFIKQGEKVMINTDTKEYVERVNT